MSKGININYGIAPVNNVKNANKKLVNENELELLANELKLLRSLPEFGGFERWDKCQKDIKQFLALWESKAIEKLDFPAQACYHNEGYYNVITGSYHKRHPMTLTHYKTERVQNFIKELNENFRLPVNHIFICNRLDDMDQYLMKYDYSNTNGFCSRVMFKNIDVLRWFLRYIIRGLIDKDKRLILMFDESKDFWDRYKILDELVQMLNQDDNKRQAKEENDKQKLEEEHKKRMKDCYLVI